ncbi:MAG: hypothetical protein IJV22_03245 [Bacteroidales bacterium]|nr:hypothetical protein [Bacteroidales bacterium]
MEVQAKLLGNRSGMLWHMYLGRLSKEYCVVRDVFRSILQERGLNVVQRYPALEQQTSQHNLLTYQPVNLPQP